MGYTINRAIICVVVALIAIPVVFSFPCNRWGGECSLVWYSPLPLEEKYQIIASMIDNARTWNTQFGVKEPPKGLTPRSEQIVKDAWIKIMAVMPSVYENETLLIPGYGEVISKSYYRVEVPNGKEGNDCRTNYYLNYKSNVKHYLNGRYLGQGDIVSFSTSDQYFNFRADLEVHTELSVSHYRWTKTRRGWSCRYYRSEVRHNTFVVWDSVNAKRHEPELSYVFKRQDWYYGIWQILFTANNTAKYRVQFNKDEYFEKNTFVFEPFFSLEPYYVLNFRVKNVSEVKHRDLRYQNNTFQVTDIDGCYIHLSDYFRTKKYPCPLVYSPTKIEVKTDKMIYKVGEIIHVRISPMIPTSIKYGNQSVEDAYKADFVADKKFKLIEAVSDGKKAYKSVIITRLDWKVLLGIIISFAVLYIIWLGVKRNVLQYP